MHSFERNYFIHSLFSFRGFIRPCLYLKHYFLNIICLFFILQFLLLFTHSLTDQVTDQLHPSLPQTLTWLSVWPVVTQCLCTCVQVTTPTATLWPTETWSAWTKDASPLWSWTTDGCLWKTLSAGRTASTPGQWSAYNPEDLKLWWGGFSFKN